MELIFNELSIDPICANKYKANERMETFVKAISIARKQSVKNIRSELPVNSIILAENYSMHDWMYNKTDIPEIYRNFLVGMFILPFIKEDDEEIENEYIQSNFFFEDDECGIEKVECYGMASSFLYETPSISLTSLPVWEKTVLEILIETENNNEGEKYIINTKGNVFNISSEKSFEDKDLDAFFDSIREINLTTTKLTPDEKKIHLADHHGKADLQTLCDRLKHNELVIEMRSMEWCRGKCDKLIKKAHNNGVIEVVLYKTDRKYGLWIQTTGTNMKETKAIARILEEKYS